MERRSLVSTQSSDSPRSLPERPNLRHLKDQAKDLLKAGEAKSITEAQFKLARSYGFASWPKLKAHVDSIEEFVRLKLAIDKNDVELVKSMMIRNPELHRAPLGYGQDGPLTWAAECRVPRVAPGPERLAMVRWMVENGSNIHRGGDAPLMRAALDEERIPMMELLISLGANVNAAWHGWYPIIFATCEAVNPEGMRWLLDHGADPNCGAPEDWKDPKHPHPGTALDYVIGSYGRLPERLSTCIEILLAAGGRTRYSAPPVLAVLRMRQDLLDQELQRDPQLVHRRFPELDCGTTASRAMTVKGGALLHLAAEYHNLEAAKLLLDRGADVNARADVDEAGVGGQTPIFHAASQYEDGGLEIVRLLLARGADLSMRAKIPGDYERPGEIVDATPLGYALQFPGGESMTIALLREHGAKE
jgi:hypothetical protein